MFFQHLGQLTRARNQLLQPRTKVLPVTLGLLGPYPGGQPLDSIGTQSKKRYSNLMSWFLLNRNNAELCLPELPEFCFFWMNGVYKIASTWNSRSALKQLQTGEVWDRTTSHRTLHELSVMPDLTFSSLQWQACVSLPLFMLDEVTEDIDIRGSRWNTMKTWHIKLKIAQNIIFC